MVGGKHGTQEIYQKVLSGIIYHHLVALARHKQAQMCL